MTDQPYSNRELDAKFEKVAATSNANGEMLAEKIDNLQQSTDKKLDSIESHVKYTNGQVASLKLWRAYMTGAIAILTAIILPVLLLIIAKFL